MLPEEPLNFNQCNVIHSLGRVEALFSEPFLLTSTSVIYVYFFKSTIGKNAEICK